MQSKTLQTVEFHYENWRELLTGKGWFFVRHNQNIYRIQENGETIETLGGKTFLMDLWFVRSHHLLTKEIGHTWDAYFIPEGIIQEGKVAKPIVFKRMFDEVQHPTYTMRPKAREWANLHNWKY